MVNENTLKNTQIFVLGVCIVIATIVSSIIFSKGFLKVMQFKQGMITVTGSTQKEIISDFTVWNGNFSRREVDLATAYKNLKEDLEKVKSYLISKGVNEKEIIVSQISTKPICDDTWDEKGDSINIMEGYHLEQSVQILSNKVYEIEKLSRESTELIDQGVQFESLAPEYFYSKLEELKTEMLARATENGKQRAGNMAKATGNKIGFMRSAEMGEFQITPVNFTEVSDCWGRNDTDSLVKKVTAVVTVSFAIE